MDGTSTCLLKHTHSSFRSVFTELKIRNRKWHLLFKVDLDSTHSQQHCIESFKLQIWGQPVVLSGSNYWQSESCSPVPACIIVLHLYLCDNFGCYSLLTSPSKANSQGVVSYLVFSQEFWGLALGPQVCLKSHTRRDSTKFEPLSPDSMLCSALLMACFLHIPHSP